MELQTLTDYADKVRRNKGRTSNGLEFIIALKDGNTDEQSQLNGHPLRTVSESCLLDSLVNFDDYFRDLTKRVEKDCLTGSNLTINQVYTASRYKLDKDGDAQPNLEVFLNEWLKDPSLRQIALLGEYGQGKSTISLMLSYHLMQRLQQDPHSARIPILLELRGKSPRNLREDELISTWAGRYGIDTRGLIKLLMAGRLLLIFEGFDEVDLSGDSDARINHFKIMWGLCYPKAKIMVTGRPNYFLDDTELKAALGIQASSLERPYCQAVQLVPFNIQEIEHSLRNLDNETREGIVALAAVNERFYDIISRPSMLYVVSILWKTENLAQYGERINSALVMDIFIRHSLERQGGKGQRYDFTPPVAGKAKPAFMALNSRERAYFMEGIATYMLINELPNQITARELEEVGRLLVKAIPEAVSSVDAQGGETRKPLRQRYDLDNKPEELQTILTDVRTCGLLVPDLSRSGSFKFGHKSFMEFLSGKVYAQWCLRKELQDAEEKEVNSLGNTFNLNMRHVVWQTEVMAFAVEWIAERAKDQGQAASLLFALLFGQYNFTRKFLGIIYKLALNQLACSGYRTRLNPRIELYIIRAFLPSEMKRQLGVNANHILITLMYYFFITLIFIIISLMLRMEFTNNFVYQFVPFTLISYIILFLALYIKSFCILFYGYKKNNLMLSLWAKFRIWHAICIAAHLERRAMNRIVGVKSIILLDEVANQEPQPWTIAESLHKLKMTKKNFIIDGGLLSRQGT
ncbi:NACHT domain-containing protein [Methyloglobulus morosus]|uniref:NACHT domain-containing protein n=1 Tax=Methyloglobulus morosus TaxID=1410681 RepID=UPI00128EA402|nr:hypothetical protein [Methyloglobulus morosus]